METSDLAARPFLNCQESVVFGGVDDGDGDAALGEDFGVGRSDDNNATTLHNADDNYGREGKDNESTDEECESEEGEVDEDGADCTAGGGRGSWPCEAAFMDASWELALAEVGASSVSPKSTVLKTKEGSLPASRMAMSCLAVVLFWLPTNMTASRHMT